MSNGDREETGLWVKRRRQRLARYVEADNSNRAFIEDDRPEPIGLAFSGGGIRSATLALGLVQLLVRRNRFSAFDYISTASGGGYFGSFLRSLFLPQSAKGRQDSESSELFESEIRDQFYFAHNVLGAGPKKGNVPTSAPTPPSEDGQSAKKDKDSAVGERNPIWWLRENGRYLAPNGTTDYLMALSYIARNWTATLYVIALAMACFFVAMQLGLYVAITGMGLHGNLSVLGSLSPFLVVPILLLVLSMGIGVGYWLTEGMRYNPTSDAPARKGFWQKWRITAIAMALSVYFLLTRDMLMVQLPYDLIRKVFTDFPAVRFVPVEQLPQLARLGFYAGAAILVMAVTASFAAYALDGSKDNPTPAIRRRLTRWSTQLNHWALWCLAIALIDSAALKMRAGAYLWSPAMGVDGVWSLAIYPAIAFLIKKLPEWFSGSDSGMSRWIGKHARSVAVFSALSLYGSLAVLADLAVHMAFWEKAAWDGASEPDWRVFILFAVILFTLALMTGASSGFANLSSLHALYSSRLTRAYLGASNRDRMRSSIEVSDGHPKDFIDAQLYSEADIPAPMHLINLTLNQTRGGNQLVRRDRKGQRFTIGPNGICIDGAANGWEALNKAGAEPFSVGQLAAISGAAASSAMGRQTSLGAALGLTFANVRLGYWWDRGTDRLQTGDEAITPDPPSFWLRPFETFIYLFNEMTSRFSLDYRHYYLSDGGHSENSGALELLRRQCKFILVSDGGQDEKFLFTDLEIFIRTARIDLGFEISVASEDHMTDFVGQRASRHFFNKDGPEWRAKAAEAGGKAFALLLTARRIGDKKAGAPPEDNDFLAHIIWIKPRIFDGLSTDIASYAAQNTPFPHQSTIDQFFDEAQWESYRRLGYEMASCLFADDKAYADVPIIRPAKQADDTSPA